MWVEVIKNVCRNWKLEKIYFGNSCLYPFNWEIGSYLIFNVQIKWNLVLVKAHKAVSKAVTKVQKIFKLPKSSSMEKSRQYSIGKVQMLKNNKPRP